jgi:hypothetical protein
MGGALDAASHRLDAWATALATRRIAQLRSKTPKGTAVGGFGWVENLVARPQLEKANPPIPGEPDALDDPANAGYLQAPSVQQATTAAVLRSGYLTHNPLGTSPGPGASFAIDLSSRRARLAGWILDGVRQGQPLAALLGYRFERALQEGGLGQLVEGFRHVAPYDGAISAPGTNPLDPVEFVRAGDVVDGVALLRIWQSAPAPSGEMWTKAHDALVGLEDAYDAAADAVVAEALHQTLAGSTHAASATLGAVADGAVPPPPLQFLNTTRTGIAITQRVLLHLPVGDGALPGSWPQTPRGRAEPALDHWLAGLFGDPADTGASVQFVDPGGTPLAGGPAPITLSTLGIGPLDLVALAGQPAELERLAVFKAAALRKPADPPIGGGTLDDASSGAARSLAAVLAVARSAGRLIGTGRGADARDLVPAGATVDSGADLNDLAARVNDANNGVVAGLQAAANALAAAIPGGPTGQAPGMLDPAPAGANPAALSAALLRAVALGIPDSAPAGYGAGFTAQLLGQARAAWNECSRRMNAIKALDPLPGTAAPAVLAARLSQLQAAFGGGFRALPRVTTNPPDLLAKAVAATAVNLTDAGQTLEAWIYKVSRVHPSLADLLDTWCASEALQAAAPLALTAGQLPLPASGSTNPWVGQPFTGDPPAANTLSLVMAGGAAPATGPMSVLFVADWVEVIPSQKEVTAVAYHYDAPTAQAPQSILLAVPARADASLWTYADLLATITTGLDLAHARSVDYPDLPGLARLVLPAAYFRNPDEGHSAIPASLPSTYLQQIPKTASISGVDPVTIVQGAQGVITLHGANFTQLTAAAFTVNGVGVTVNGGSINSDTSSTLLVSVDVNAPTGTRNVRLGAAVSSDSHVTIAPQPRATYCNTVQLSQALSDVTKTITVTGRGLTGANVTLTPAAGLTWTVTTADSQVLITVHIPASQYDPNADGDPAGDHVHGQPPRQPRHELIHLTLAVTPIGGPVATFGINLDTIQ